MQHRAVDKVYGVADLAQILGERRVEDALPGGRARDGEDEQDDGCSRGAVSEQVWRCWMDGYVLAQT